MESTTKTYTKETMPYKITLNHYSGIKYVYYRSTTEYLQYDDSKFTVQILQERGSENTQRRLGL